MMKAQGLCRYFKVDRIVYSPFNKTIISFRTIFVAPEVPFEEAARQSLAVECLGPEADIGRNGLMSHHMLYDDEKETRISINVYNYPDGSSYFTSYEYAPEYFAKLCSESPYDRVSYWLPADMPEYHTSFLDK